MTLFKPPKGWPSPSYPAQDQRQQRSQRLIFSQDDFRRSIQLITRQGNGYGTTLVFAGPFTVSAPLIIPEEAAGLVVTSAGKFGITATGVVSSLFEVYCRDSVIQNLYLPPPDGWVANQTVSNNVFTDFIVVPRVPSQTIGPLTIADNNVSVQRSLFREDGTSCGDAVTIRSNFLRQLSEPLSSETMIEIHAPNFRIIDNQFAPWASGGPHYGVLVSDGADRGLILGNNFDAEVASNDGIVIDTTDGGGETFLACNIGFGAAGVANKRILSTDFDLDRLTSNTTLTNLLPGVDDGYDMGSTSKRWQDGYFSRVLAVDGNLNVDGYGQFNSALELAELTSSATTPASGRGRLYAKTDGIPYWKDDSGTETSLLSSGGWTLVKKSSDESRQEDTTLTADSTLSVSLGASKSYAFRAVIFYMGDASADFKFDFNHSSAPTRQSYSSTYGSGGGTPTLQATTNGPPSSVFISANPTLPGLIQFDAVIDTNAATTFAFRWAQSASVKANTTVLKGSYFEYIEV